MEVGDVVLRLDALRVQLIRKVGVKHMEVVHDAYILDVKRVPYLRPRSVLHTVVENDVLIVLTGSILGLVQNSMMVIVRHVLSNSFQTMNVVRFYIYTRKRSVFVMPSTRILKVLFTTSHCIRVIVIAR
jgi:hypothetical protein